MNSELQMLLISYNKLFFLEKYCIGKRVILYEYMNMRVLSSINCTAFEFPVYNNDIFNRFQKQKKIL